MPVVPEFNAQLTPNPVAAPLLPMGGGAAAAASEGADRIVGAAENFADRYAAATRAANASNFNAEASVKLGDMQHRWSLAINPATGLPDRTYSEQGFQAEAGQYRDQVLGGITDPLVKAHVTASINSELGARTVDTANAAFQLESSARRGQLDTNLLSLAQAAATTDNPFLRAKLQGQAKDSVMDAAAVGWIAPEEAQKHLIGFNDRIASVQADNFIRTATQGSPDQRMDPISLANAVADPNNFPGMTPTTRAQKADTAIRLGRTIVSIQAAAEAHADAVADRDLKRGQALNESTILSGIYQGKTIDPAQLDIMARTQQITPGGLEAIHSAQTRAKEGTDDPKATLQLYSQLGAGKDIHGDIVGALSAGTVSGKTAVSLMNANREQQTKQFPDAISKSSFEQLKTSIGGAAVEQGIVMPWEKSEDAAAHRQLWSQAQGEWFNRTLVKHEDPGAVLADMLPRYQKNPVNTNAWPNPRLGAIGSTQDATAVWAKTVAAKNSGQITDRQFQDEAGLIDRYRAFYAAQDARQAAAPRPAAGGKGGAVKSVIDTSGGGQ